MTAWTLALAVTAAAAPPADPAALAAARNQFALELYARVRGREGNLALSPDAVASALTLAGAGAGGKTATAFARVLHTPSGDSLAAAAALDRAVRPAGGPLTGATAVWLQEGLTPRPTFRDRLTAHAGGPPRAIDFRGNPAAARAAVNAWAAQHTIGAVKELLAPQQVDARTRAVLTSVVAFRGRWTEPFSPRQTKDGPFRTAGGPVTVPFMCRRGPARYADADGVELLELPYGGSTLVMTLLLPDEDRPLAEFEKGLTPARLGEWLAALKTATVDVALPRFTVSDRHTLRPALSAMGLKEAFGAKADFRGIVDTPEPLALADVVHQTAVTVDEEGTTVAAAAAAVIKGRGVPGMTEFRADRPFLFLIRDVPTGAIVFIGRLSTPAAAPRPDTTTPPAAAAGPSRLGKMPPPP
jgi:serpin B